MKRYNSGITLVALVITIIVMMIIASIAVYEGKELIQQSKIQTIETNMLTIQAKAKAYAEEIDSKVWALSDKESKRENEFEKKGLENVGEKQYKVTNDGIEKMGLSDLKGDEYIVEFDSDYKVRDVIYSKGIKYKGETYNKLSEIQQVLDE